MSRIRRSPYDAHRAIAIGTMCPYPIPRPLPLRTRRAQVVAGWCMLAMVLLWGGACMV